MPANIETMRTFHEWWSSLPKKIKEDIPIDKKPMLSQVNYVWITSIMNDSKSLNPSTDELLDWIVSGQIDARRK